jgi:DNA-binding MurR/RpiR family transcriptional regulator
VTEPVRVELRIDERIAEHYTGLSPQERRAADVLLAHLDDLAIYRAAELADLAGVSKATMSRLFRHLGFDDFGEVREHLQIRDLVLQMRSQARCPLERHRHSPVTQAPQVLSHLTEVVEAEVPEESAHGRL